MIRVVLPPLLSQMAKVNREIELQVAGVVTQCTILDALETRYPVLRGTIRDQTTLQRRAFVRFFACGQDLSHEPMDDLMPDSVANGAERLIIVGAIAGG
jgi:sulfur-carrier protein